MDITIENLSKKYGDTYALYHFSTKLQPGTLIGLIGPNGAGKSTFLQILATLIRPTEGKIFLDGNDIIRHPDEMRKILGYLPQQAAIYPNLTTIEFLSHMAAMKQIASEHAKKQIESLLEELHLTQYSTKRLATFSGGMKQRVGLACALLGNPQVVIVDEPTAGLDPQERISVRNLLAEYAKSHVVILSTHVISDIEAAASRLLILKKSLLLFDGKPEQMIQKATGHVWEYIRPTDFSISQFSGISKITQQKNGILIRQVTDKQPFTDAKITEPSLEDACIYELEESYL